MGSLFTIEVPTREFEVLRRKLERQLSIVKVVDSGSLIGEGASATSSEPSAAISEGDENRDVYIAKVRGGSDQVQVVITDDKMEILDLNDGGENETETEQEDEKKKLEDTFLESHVEYILKKFGVSSSKSLSGDENYFQYRFAVSAEKEESIISHLRTAGVGSKYHSSICVCAASVYYEEEPDFDGELANPQEKQTKWNEFVSSIKSRLTVAQVVQSVRTNAVLTFDFLVLIVIAAMIAGLGLVDDSPVNVIAAMLVSPLMGPIMAGTFSAVIRDWELMKIGVTNELIGLFICLLVGFIFGIMLQVPWDESNLRGPWANVTVWPTGQMESRSELRALAIGIMVAIPSGVGVALSILAGNSGSLVGVAISASLLPPAVNCGILWGSTAVIAILERANKSSAHVGCQSKLSRNYSINHLQLYCENTAHEYFFMGLCSFGLTMINIIVIFLVGVIILKIKEVAPHTTRESLNKFWKEDIKIMRDFNSQGKGGVAALTADLKKTGKEKEILSNLSDDPNFTAVNRRVTIGRNILNDVRHRKLGSSEDVSSTSKGLRGSGQQPHTGGWLSSWFGLKRGETLKDKPAPPTVENNNRPKLI